jgi:hypothetical protein
MARVSSKTVIKGKYEAVGGVEINIKEKKPGA